MVWGWVVVCKYSTMNALRHGLGSADNSIACFTMCVGLAMAGKFLEQI